MARSAVHGRKTHARAGLSPVVVPVAGTALLLIDVINDLAFDGAEAIVAQAESMAAPLERTVAHCTARSSPGHLVSRRLRPTARDYFVLKPKHSGFFGTTLDTLLEALRIRRVILTGIAGNICVLFTANDAYMREYRIFAPADCIVSNTAADNDHALRQIKTVLKGNVAESTRLRFHAHRQVRTARAE